MRGHGASERGGIEAKSAPGIPRRPSHALLRLFDVYLQFFIKRHFHAVRLAGAEHWPGSPVEGGSSDLPLVVCLNHPSWWDPLTAIVLSRYLERDADHYAPIDALAMERYGVLQSLGLFAVEQGTRKGAVQFLRSATAVLGAKRSVLWVTPQGGFTDVRARPVSFRAGLDALLRRMPRVQVLPLALEYTFWDERLPEALALLGEPLVFAAGDGGVHLPPGQRVAMALEQTQDALASLAARRDATLFTPVLMGFAGTSGVYGGWQRLRAKLRGERFAPEHASLRARAQSRDV